MKQRWQEKILHYKKYVLRVVSILVVLYFVLPYCIPAYIQPLPNSTIVYDIHGQEIGEIIAQQTYRHRSMRMSDTPDFLQKILVGIEDIRFYEHNGIDRYALGRAMVHNIQAVGIVEGGSTISAQLIRNTYWLNEPRGLWRKIGEFVGARSIERKYTKEEILLAYMDRLYMGYMNYGFASAAKRYFGRDLQHLTPAELLALVTIAKNANTYDPYVQQEEFRHRFTRLAQTLYENKTIDKTMYERIVEEKLMFNADHTTNFPYVIDFISTSPLLVGNVPIAREEGQGVRSNTIHTTIDSYLTQEIAAIGKQVVMDLQRKNVGDYGVLVVDKNTDELRVMIGGIAYDGIGGQVNATTAINQAGSVMKPFTYMLAFKDLGYTPESIIVDEPVQFPTVDTYAYTPKNYSLDYKGEVTFAEALAQSLNVPAVKIAAELTPQKLLDWYHTLQFDSLNKGADHYGLALTLGVGEVSLRELVRGYGVFAHDGQLCQIQIFSGEQTDCVQIIEKTYTDMIVKILADRFFKLESFPVYSNLDFPDRRVFAKSGTSRNFSDNRVIGFTDSYIIGVRVGNKDGSNMKGVSGVSGAGEIFQRIVYLLEKRTIEKKPIVVEKETIDPYVSITAPLPGSVFMIDPAIPRTAQKIAVEFITNTPYDTAVRTFNDTIFSGKLRPVQTGKYDVQVELFDEGISVGKDAVKIEVR